MEYGFFCFLMCAQWQISNKVLCTKVLFDFFFLSSNQPALFWGPELVSLSPNQMKRNIVIAIHTFILHSFQCGRCRYGRPFETVKTPRFWQAALRIISVSDTQKRWKLGLGWMVSNFCTFSLLPHECTIGQGQVRTFRAGGPCSEHGFVWFLFNLWHWAHNLSFNYDTFM